MKLISEFDRQENQTSKSRMSASLEADMYSPQNVRLEVMKILGTERSTKDIQELSQGLSESVDDHVSHSLTGVSVLLVDDSVDNQKLFERFLISSGAKVDLAENGLEAVQLQLVRRYDVIIMDIRMPVMDGYEATRKIRSNGFSGPIIALTAHATPGEEQRCLDAGCSDFQSKPIGRRGLIQAVLTACASAL